MEEIDLTEIAIFGPSKHLPKITFKEEKKIWRSLPGAQWVKNIPLLIAETQIHTNPVCVNQGEGVKNSSCRIFLPFHLEMHA